MQKIYIAADPQDAQIIKDQLEGGGFDVQMRGQTLWGARGELPLTIDTAPSLWVADDRVDEALTFIRELEKNLKKVFPVWECQGCGETIEGNFSCCWNCLKPQGGS
jgi:hypothetical protein